MRGVHSLICQINHLRTYRPVTQRGQRLRWYVLRELRATLARRFSER